MLSQIIGYTLLVLVSLFLYYKTIMIIIELYKGWVILLKEKLQIILNICTNIDTDIWFIYCFPYITVIIGFLLWQSIQNIYVVFIHIFCSFIVYTRIIENNENMSRYTQPPKNKDETPFYLTYIIE